MQRDFQLKLKSLDEASGTFTGYASTYGPPADLGGDIIEQGAFKQAIAQQGRGYPLLWAHNTAEPLGLARISDSNEGLVVDGTLLMSDPAARRAYDHAKMGSCKGLSIGYDIPKGDGKAVYQSDGSRLLREIRLHEISLCALPMNPRAQVTAIKSLPDVRHALKAIRDADVDSDAVSMLVEISRELERLLNGHDPAEEQAALLAELQACAAALRM